MGVLRMEKLVRPRQVKELLQDTGWQLDEDLTQAVREVFNNPRAKAPGIVYTHTDGRTMHLYAGMDSEGTFYLTRERLVEKITRVRAAMARGTHHMLEGHFLYGEDFPQHVPALLDQIPALFKVPREALDHSWESLDLLTRKVKHLGRKRALEPQYFAPIVAYIGECIRVQVKGEWLMVQSWQHQAIWEPCVRGKDGRIHDAFFVYYEMLDNTANTPGPISLASAVSFARPTRDPNQPSSAVFALGMIQSDLKPDE